MKTYTQIVIVFFCALIISFSTYAQHTFSIVAVDPVTGEIGSAGATCISAEDGAQAISAIVLGVGAIHTQSFWDPNNQNNATARMVAGDSPQQIMDWLVANDVANDSSQRQYVAVDLNGGSPRSAGFTGPDCFREFIHVTGPNYAIAGNILISENVVNDMETAFLNTNGSLADKLMAAMQGAKRPGADSRCLSSGISSASAFIRVADPSDTDNSYGSLTLDLNVWITTTVFEPIDALQNAYNTTLGVEDFSSSDEILSDFIMFPNPVDDTVVIRSDDDTVITSYKIMDISGKVIDTRSINSPKNNLYIDVINYPKGTYFIHLYDREEKITSKKIIIK
ncbi:DUF1028 domain-containing protein [Aquimarina sp. 2201CG5-10]|uniref:DUF1028 domain-containing protein n=1 Tax=Aquimarina callyspongiae TaxID=3098150 RepID=UPI002AB59928|nr:DUF1028 domain-containing protein [Aquimarina sp. 2201CG5-10]MDY8135121.1 DUF1028 domain-containing protein [Aquimarina sp. 2201CG5-10]